MVKISPIQYVPIIGGAFVATFGLWFVIFKMPYLQTNDTDSETDQFARDVSNPQGNIFPANGGKTKRNKRKRQTSRK